MASEQALNLHSSGTLSPDIGASKVAVYRPVGPSRSVSRSYYAASCSSRYDIRDIVIRFIDVMHYPIRLQHMQILRKIMNERFNWVPGELHPLDNKNKTNTGSLGEILVPVYRSVNPKLVDGSDDIDGPLNGYRNICFAVMWKMIAFDGHPKWVAVDSTPSRHLECLRGTVPERQYQAWCLFVCQRNVMRCNESAVILNQSATPVNRSYYPRSPFQASPDACQFEPAIWGDEIARNPTSIYRTKFASSVTQKNHVEPFRKGRIGQLMDAYVFLNGVDDLSSVATKHRRAPVVKPDGGKVGRLRQVSKNAYCNEDGELSLIVASGCHAQLAPHNSVPHRYGLYKRMTDIATAKLALERREESTAVAHSLLSKMLERFFHRRCFSNSSAVSSIVAANGKPLSGPDDIKKRERSYAIGAQRCLSEIFDSATRPLNIVEISSPDWYKEIHGDRQQCYTFNRSKQQTWKDRTDFQVIYGDCIRPLLEYANQVVLTGRNRDLTLIERVPRALTKMVPGPKSLGYETRLVALDLFSLEYRRLRGDLILIYVLSEEGRPTGFSLLTYHHTPGHGEISELREHTFIVWNNLPLTVVHAASGEQKPLNDKNKHQPRNLGESLDPVYQIVNP
ncbi:hypothetical protein CLF_108628 [Clonorchis sinensis]|uniref:Uncharacterized protein n=1 Tax=Clonorchis sinensis TaxID=79923 RepID=G7YIA4_CLOSI|nr:hypothetical protein CLF_108628 [Clonorchis sinensis]